MEFEFTIKNYRCFADTKPAHFSIRQGGFIAFVGVNNSGKTTLLKFFYELRLLFQQMTRGGLEQALKSEDSFQLTSSVDYDQIFSKFNNRDIVISIKIPQIKTLKQETSLFPEEIVFTIIRQKKSPSFKVKIRPDNGFIPNEEGMKAIQELLTNTLYIGSFRNALNLGTTEKDYYDIKVGQSMIKMWREMKTGRNTTENEAAFRVTEDIKRILKFEQFEINSSSDDDTFQVFINNKSFKLYEIGAGLVHFMVCFANAAKRQPSLILIDEPELNLHPSLQIDFLTTLASYAKYGVIFATHSIGLARAIADTIYSLRKSKNGECELRPLEGTPCLTEFLGELGYSSYREMGFEGVLLVEGVTDVRTIQQFLRLYKKDHTFLLIPLGGNQFINGACEQPLSELTRIPAKFFALIDSEKKSAKEPLASEREEFRKICEKIGIKCHVLEHRAIENYLTDTAIKQEKGNKYQALGYYESLDNMNQGWAKADNWRIARRMELRDIENTDLGRFLASI